MNPVLVMVDISEYKNKTCFDEAYDKLPKSRRIKIDSLRNESGKLQSLGAGVAHSRAHVRIGSDLKDDGWEISIDEFGKPRFDKHSEVHFSLSHSGRYAVCALSDKEIGCDIEQNRKGCACEKVASRFFAHAEQGYLDNFTDADKRISVFFDIWTRKESYIKAVGRGLAIPLHSFSVIDATGRPVTDIDGYLYDNPDVEVSSDYSLSLCRKME